MGDTDRHRLSHRRTLAALLVCFLAVVLAAPAGAATDAPASTEGDATLTPQEPGGGTMTVDFGQDRAERTLTLLYTSSKALTAAPAVALTQARTTDGSLFQGTVSAMAELSGDRLVKVNVAVDPDHSRPGSFTSKVLLRGAGIADEDSLFTVTFTRTPSQGIAWVLAFSALALGVALGGALRWLSGTGSKLRSLTLRLDTITASLQDAQHLPPALERDLAEIRSLLAGGDTTNAETKIAAVEEEAPATAIALDFIRRQAGAVKETAERIRAIKDLDDATTRGLLDVVDAEGDWLESMTADAYPGAAAGKDARSERATWITGFHDFVRLYQDPAYRTGDWAEALKLYRSGKFGEAFTKWTGAAAREGGAAAAIGERAGAATPVEGDAPVGVGAPSTPGQPAGSVAKARWLLANAKWFFIRHAPAAVGLIFAIGLIIVGLQTVFDVKTMFLTDDVNDFLTLLAWGFASALVGMTTTDLAAKLTPSASGKTASS